VKIAYYILLFCLLLSCDESAIRTVDCRKFTIDIPKNWTYEEGYTWGLMSGMVTMTDGQKASLTIDTPADGWIADAGTHNIVLELIDNKQARVFSPKSFQEGTTGVYIDSLYASRTWAFIMRAENLSQRNQELLLAAIRTLNFKD
jgi:hypothetical protein